MKFARDFDCCVVDTTSVVVGFSLWRNVQSFSTNRMRILQSLVLPCSFNWLLSLHLSAKSRRGAGSRKALTSVQSKQCHAKTAPWLLRWGTQFWPLTFNWLKYNQRSKCLNSFDVSVLPHGTASCPPGTFDCFPSPSNLVQKTSARALVWGKAKSSYAPLLISLEDKDVFRVLSINLVKGIRLEDLIRAFYCELLVYSNL